MNKQPSCVVNIVEYVCSIGLPVTLTIMLSLAITRGQVILTFIVFGVTGYCLMNINKWEPIHSLAYLAAMCYLFAHLV